MIRTDEEYSQDISEILSLLKSLKNNAEEFQKNQEIIQTNQKEIRSLQAQILQILTEINEVSLSQEEDDE